jgi:hypothetical protein
LKSTDRFLVEGVVCHVHGQALPVANLSVGGFFAATASPPPAGELLELELALTGQPPFRVTGKVVWINAADRVRADRLPCGFGFKITKIALPHKIAILDFLKRSAPSRPSAPAAPR